MTHVVVKPTRSRVVQEIVFAVLALAGAGVAIFNFPIGAMMVVTGQGMLLHQSGRENRDLRTTVAGLISASFEKEMARFVKEEMTHGNDPDTV